MPEVRDIKRCIKSIRKKIQNILVEPKNLRELTIALEYTQLDDGSLFLLHNSGLKITVYPFSATA